MPSRGPESLSQSNQHCAPRRDFLAFFFSPRDPPVLFKGIVREPKQLLSLDSCSILRGSLPALLPPAAGPVINRSMRSFVFLPLFFRFLRAGRSEACASEKSMIEWKINDREAFIFQASRMSYRTFLRIFMRIQVGRSSDVEIKRELFIFLKLSLN